MSAPNGQRGAKTPSNISTPAPSAGTVHSGLGPSLIHAMVSGESNTGASAFQTTHTSMNAGQGQTAGTSNAAAQTRARNPLGRGRGAVRARGRRHHDFASPPRIMRRATVQAPGAGGQGGGTHSVLGKRGSESMEDVSEEITANRPLKPQGLPHRPELSSQASILNEVTNVEPMDRSGETTSIMIQRNTSRGVEIDLKLDPDTEDGREMLLDAARRVRRKNGNVDILVSMRPAPDKEALERVTSDEDAYDSDDEDRWQAQRQAARQAHNERRVDPFETNRPDRPYFLDPEYIAREEAREGGRLDPSQCILPDLSRVRNSSVQKSPDDNATG